jgi:2-oxoglutarate ferredoxin oxidoreductase subunit delta
MVCPNNSIIISEQSNKNGYFPAQTNNTDCTGCAACAIICPEAVIEVHRDEPGKVEIIVEPANESKPDMIKGKV